MFSGRVPTGTTRFILNAELYSEDELTASMPVSGTVEWPTLSSGNIDPDTTFPTDLVDAGTCYAPEEIAVDIDTGDTDELEEELSGEGLAALEEELLNREQELAPQQDLTEQEEEELELTDEAVVPGEDMIDIDEDAQGEEFPIPETDACAELAAQSGDEKKFANSASDATQTTTTRWTLIEIEGVTMIEVQLPDIFLSGNGEQATSMLLIEHEGVVRQGVMMSNTYIGTAVTYNEAAFITMQAIAERVDAR